MCFHILDNHLNISEHFLRFFETPFTLFNLLISVLSQFDIDISKFRGQCHDGAATVSGHISGLQRRIMDVEPRATFVHCNAHTLNLEEQDTM